MQSNVVLDVSDVPAWSPQAGSQTIFLACPVYECLYEGTRGPGKTDALLMDFAQHIGQGFGGAWRGILFRNTFPQLEEVIAKSKKWFHQIFPEPQARYNEGNYTWKWRAGEQLYFRHMNRPETYWDYHGHEYPWIGWEELTNWPTSDCYDDMKACCRSSHPGVPRKYRSTANPYGPGHNWVKSRFVDIGPPGTIVRDEKGRERTRVHGTIRENKILLRADPDYLKTLQSISNPNKRKAWLLGSWDIVAGGAIDDLWDENVHVFPWFEVPSSWYVDRSFDWGSSKPFSVGFWAESDGSDVQVQVNGVRHWFNFYPGTLFRVNEFYGWNGKPNEGNRMVSTEIAREIKKIEREMRYYVRPGPADNTISDPEEKGSRSIADKMASVGIRWKRSDKSPGSRISGLEDFREMLDASLKYPLERAGIFVMDNCIHFRRTIPVLPRDPRKPDDVDTNSEDHVWDETRYRILMKKFLLSTAKIKGF